MRLCVGLSDDGADPTCGLSPELLMSLALKRAHSGRLARLGGRYYDWGHRTPSHWATTFTDLVDGGLLTLADPDQWGMQRVSLTAAGQARYAQLSNTPRRARQLMPNPHVPDKAPAGRMSSVEQLRWARCFDETRLHLLHPVQVPLAAAEGHAQALCGKRIPAEGLTIDSGPWGPPCTTCVVELSTVMPDPGSPGP